MSDTNSEFWDGLCDPVATIRYPAVPALADLDDDDAEREETELDYSTGEWCEIGVADGSSGAEPKPPHEEGRKESYLDGWAVGRTEWMKARDHKPAPDPDYDGSDIPF